MATTKKRRMVSLPDDVDSALEHLAARDGIPPATKAASLIQLAIEIDEDMVWDRIASERDNEKTKFVSHDEAWA
ncbi:MAG: hypothetical protein ACI9QC_000863 [Oceanicoccus sp.]|jgi:hypothetical protein